MIKVMFVLFFLSGCQYFPQDKSLHSMENNNATKWNSFATSDQMNANFTRDSEATNQRIKEIENRQNTDLMNANNSVFNNQSPISSNQLPPIANL